MEARPSAKELMSHRQIEHPSLAPLKAAFPDMKFLVGEFRDMVTVVVPARRYCRSATTCDEPTQHYELLAEVNGVDYLNYPGAMHRFAVNYGLVSVQNGRRLWLKVFFDPTISSTTREFSVTMPAVRNASQTGPYRSGEVAK